MREVLWRLYLPLAMLLMPDMGSHLNFFLIALFPRFLAFAFFISKQKAIPLLRALVKDFFSILLIGWLLGRSAL